MPDIKIKKDGQEYGIGVIPQSLYDDVEDLKDRSIILQNIASTVSTVTDAISNIYNQLSELGVEMYPINYSVFWAGHDRYYGEAILYSNSAHLTLIGYNSMYICDVDNGTISYKTVTVT